MWLKKLITYVGGETLAAGTAIAWQQMFLSSITVQNNGWIVTALKQLETVTVGLAVVLLAPTAKSLGIRLRNKILNKKIR